MKLVVTTPETTVAWDQMTPERMKQSLDALREMAQQDGYALTEFDDGRIQVVWPNGRYLIARPVAS